jgi:hypothetical protein
MVTACGILAPAAFANAAVASAATLSTPPRSPQVPPRPAAFADSAVASAATRSTPRPSPRGPERRSAASCIAYITAIYPEIPSATVAVFCNIAANATTLNHWLYAIAVGVCIGGLVANGVDRVDAVIACNGANTHLPFVEEQWCVGSEPCLNAWSGGPHVNEYTGGPETNDSNQDFFLVNENANADGSGYNQIMFAANGNAWSDDCVGDYNNNSGLADAGLVGCGSASGGQGWGTNMTVGTSGCPSGEAWFFDIHWNGYLGPGGTANGSHFYLNKPSPYCFSVTYTH